MYLQCSSANETKLILPIVFIRIKALFTRRGEIYVPNLRTMLDYYEMEEACRWNGVRWNTYCKDIGQTLLSPNGGLFCK